MTRRDDTRRPSSDEEWHRRIDKIRIEQKRLVDQLAARRVQHIERDNRDDTRRDGNPVAVVLIIAAAAVCACVVAWAVWWRLW